MSIDPENPDLINIKTLKQDISIKKSQLFPLCNNYNEASDQLARLNRGIEMDKNLENEVGGKIKSNVFYSRRGFYMDKKLKDYEADKEIEFETNDDIYELILIDSEDDSNVFLLGFHSNHDLELDSLKLGNLIRENGHNFEVKE